MQFPNPHNAEFSRFSQYSTTWHCHTLYLNLSWRLCLISGILPHHLLCMPLHGTMPVQCGEVQRMVIMTRNFFINTFQTEHFLAVKFAMCYEKKKWAFLWNENLQTFEKGFKQLEWTPCSHILNQEMFYALDIRNKLIIKVLYSEHTWTINDYNIVKKWEFICVINTAIGARHKSVEKTRISSTSV